MRPEDINFENERTMIKLKFLYWVYDILLLFYTHFPIILTLTIDYYVVLYY